MLQSIATDIWVHDGEIRLPLGHMPARATLFRAGDGGLVLHSPLALDDETAREIARLGEVRAIVAPSAFHHMFLRAASERFPSARLYGPASLAPKLGGLAFQPLPASGHVDAFGPDVLVRKVEGAPSLDEHVFYHRPSRTLVVTDLLFNLHRCRSTALKLVFMLGRTWKRPAQSLAFRFLVKDRAATAGSMRDILAWDFERLAPAHGDVLEDRPREILRSATRWLSPRDGSVAQVGLLLDRAPEPVGSAEERAHALPR